MVEVTGGFQTLIGYASSWADVVMILDLMKVEGHNVTTIGLTGSLEHMDVGEATG